MPAASIAAVRKQIAEGRPDSVYLIVGDDDAEMARLAGEFAGLLEDELRAFNAERFYAGERGVTPASIVESAQILPMMSARRVVTVFRAEKLLKPKRRGRAADADADDAEESEPPSELDLLEAYIRNAAPQTTLVLVASDVDRTRKVYKALQKHAAIVECWGLKALAANPRDVKGWELEKIGREAAKLVQATLQREGYTIDAAGARLLASRAGTDITTLRGDIDRLLLYAGERKTIDVNDVREVVSGETLQDNWALTDAILQKDSRGALRQLGLALEGGGVPYMILGQLAWCVREKMPNSDARRVPAAIEALLRTDLDLKSSGGDPRVLLERLVAELCRG